MKIMVCLDDKNGMLFGGRRQSKDRLLRQRMLALAGKQPLWMNEYSAGQFEEKSNISVDEAFLEHAPEDAWCFVENSDLTPYLPQIRQVAVYRWNRHYPATEFFPVAYFESQWQLTDTREFPGSSHDNITEEVYTV